jgi:nicotinate phosphoribosyltransferase
VLQVSNGKPILYYPARFDLPEVQALDGYAYYLAVRRYNMEYQQNTQPIVSTDAQGAWWEGKGSGTIPHALIASFVADDVEMMVNFAKHIPLTTPRILLADFNNDVVGASVATLTAFWQHYQQAYQAGDETGMKQWTLNGVRLDTSAKLRDASLDADDPKGVSPVLVRTVRNALNNAWHTWDVPPSLEEAAKTFCRQVQIVVTGGFNREKIEAFERARTPVDAYGVGSSLLSNSKDTNTDFTMDIVRIYHNQQWLDVPKVGRRPCDNPDLRRIDLSEF